MDGGMEESGKTVIVGVKIDGQSKELLTWSLVKVAQPGDLVLALHVLPSNEIVDQDGKSSLLSLVKAFDSILGVYEGFCNLKQVDLKLKICRGSSVRKIIVKEATSYESCKVIVGTATKHHTLRSSILVAKYCAKKLPKDCSVLAVRNGKIVFQREATLPGRAKNSKGTIDHQQDGILEAHQRSSTINSKINDGDENMLPNARCGQDAQVIAEGKIFEFDVGKVETISKQNCSICSGNSASNSSSQSITMTSERDGTSHNHKGKSLVSLLGKELPEHRQGWPLLCRTLLSTRKDSSASSSKDASFSTSQNCHHVEEDCICNGVENDAIVPDGNGTNQSCLDLDLNNLPKELEGLYEKYSSKCRVFKYEELQYATLNFKAENLIGKGGSSEVYRGHLSDGKELAVKILKKLYDDLCAEFVVEIETLTSLHHKNIISLIGFCYEDRNLLLVYDLLSRGSLEENLHGIKKGVGAFGWNERYKVALGVAKALHHLHYKSTQPVIHRDVKSSNILLSEDFEPRLSDFGYALRASTSSYITCTDVAGTFGYLAPEYFMYGKVTDKIDVYAFGVVLLELLTGRRPISSDPPKAQESLVMWAKPILNGGKISKLLDPCMGSNYNRDQIERMVLAATLCIRRAPRARPHMSLVLKLLQGDVDVVIWARLQVNAIHNNDSLEEEGLPHPDIQSHLNLALLDVEDDSLSVSSIEQHISLEEYLRGRWSRSLSFD